MLLPAVHGLQILGNAEFTALEAGDTTTYIVDSDKDIIAVHATPHSVDLINLAAGLNVFSVSEFEKIDETLLDVRSLEEEDYLRDGNVPVIISLNVQSTGSTDDVSAAGARNFEQAKNEVLDALADEIGAAATDVKDLKIIDAIALDIGQDELDVLNSMDAVKRVDLDRRVYALLNDSVALINATLLWRQIANGSNITGANISIAIIDTGVDYTHPDLGGCLGSGCKVRGGYDFINNDANPMDDHGHGTHVAGTAASNGTLPGVAPGALVYAYKVLSAGGSGSFSTVIAGVERSTDPNNDGNYSDHLDILSMSLGGYGDESSPLSIAVNTAVDRGVVAIVAAGNSGTATGAIGTPGTAAKAITVAATTKSDAVVYFSSRGPTLNNNVKPDLAAPGVNICASQWDSAWNTRKCFDTQHVSISGTSMATPHVSGAAALLLQLHADWTPAKVKSALMSTAKDTGSRVWDQGTGRIDVLNASAAKIVTYPQSISFGQVSAANVSAVITIENINSSNVTLTLAPGVLKDDAGATYALASLNATSLTIPAGANRTVNLSIAMGSSAGTFYGYVNITDGSAIYRVPYGIIRLTQVSVRVVNGTAQLRPILLELHNSDLSTVKYAYYWDYRTNNYTFSVPAGNYTAHAIGDLTNQDTTYVLTGNTTAAIGSSAEIALDIAAANRFTMRAEQFNGNKLSLFKWQYGFQERVASRRAGMSMMYLGSTLDGNRTVYVSNTTSDQAAPNISLGIIGYPFREKPSYESTYQWRDDSFAAAGELYLISSVLRNVSGATNTTLGYAQSDFGNLSYTYNFAGWDPNENALFDSYSAIHFWISPESSFDISPWTRLAAPLRATHYVKGSDWGYNHYLHTNYIRSSSDWRNEFGLAASQTENEINVSTSWPYGLRVAANSSRTLYHGTSFLPARLANTNTTIALENFFLRGFGNETYMFKYASASWVSSDGSSGTVELPKPRVIIDRNGTIVANQTPGWKTFSYAAAAGYYIVNVTIPTAYPIFNVTEIITNFTLPSVDVSPPYVAELNVSQRFAHDTPLRIRANITDSGLVNATAYYSTNRTAWTAAASNSSGYFDVYVNLTAGTEVSLKIVGYDTRGNWANYTIMPVSLLQRNISANFASSPSAANGGTTLILSGRINDSRTNITQARIEYFVNGSFLHYDRTEFSRYSPKGIYNFRYVVPADYTSPTINFTVLFNGTGIYASRSETVTVGVNVPAQQKPTISNIRRSPAAPDWNDVIFINATVTSTNTIDKVFFESNWSGTTANYSTQKSGSVYNYTISGSLSVNQSIGFKFIANDTLGNSNATALQAFAISIISANISAGENATSVSVNGSIKLFCDYTEGGTDITSATVNADVAGANNSMTYNSSAGRYEYAHTPATTGTKTWRCYASKANYESKSASSSFGVGETTAPSFSNITQSPGAVYNNDTVLVSATWTDDTALATIIFSTNATGTWANTTVASQPPQPYVASRNISGLSNGQAVGWRFIANDTSGNLNNFMPVQGFAVGNRAPAISISSNDDNKGWGEAWSFVANASDADGDTLNVSFWLQAPAGSFVLADSRIANGSINFSSRYLNNTFIGATGFMLNASDGRVSSAANATITVEKDDVNVTANRGINETVQRFGRNTIVLGVGIFDTDRNESAGTRGRIYWTKDGQLPYDDSLECVTSSGNCTVEFDPPVDYSVGEQLFTGGTLSNDSFYKEANSSNSTYFANGTLFASVDGPAGVFNHTAQIPLNTTITDDASNPISADRVVLEYKHANEADWKVCSPVVENDNANYHCILNATNLTLGAYGVRYHAEKVNYTSVNTTVVHQFVVARIFRIFERLNITANATHNVTSGEFNTTFRIVARAAVANADFNVTFNSTNPEARNLSVAEIGKYLSINMSDELRQNLNHTIMQINYTDEEINQSGVAEESLRIYHYNGTNWTAFDPPLGGVNTTANYVWANASNFSSFGVGGKKNNGVSCASGDECNSGNCAPDYDGEGSWCAPAGNCANDYTTSYENGATLCSGSTLQTCSSGAWSATTCSNGCSAGACIASSSSGSSGGGGSAATAGGGAGAATKEKQSTIGELRAGSVAQFPFTKLDIERIDIASLATEQTAVTISEAEPVVAPEALVYRYIEITSNATRIAEANITFSVAKSWVIANNIDANTISLSRFAGAWQRLPTLPAGKTSDKFTFVATTSGFSIFAITGERMKPPVCGNGIVEEGEECDGIALADKSCASFGFAGGTLSCSGCRFDTSACTQAKVPICGNGVCELYEKTTCPADCAKQEDVSFVFDAAIIIAAVALIAIFAKYYGRAEIFAKPGKPKKPKKSEAKKPGRKKT